MNGQEKKQLDVVANDVKWLKETFGDTCDDIKETLAEIRKDLQDNNKATQKNTTFRKIGTWIGSALCLAIIGLCIKILTTGSAV